MGYPKGLCFYFLSDGFEVKFPMWKTGDSQLNTDYSIVVLLS